MYSTIENTDLFSLIENTPSCNTNTRDVSTYNDVETFQSLLASDYMYNFLSNNITITQNISNTSRLEENRMTPFVHYIKKDISALIGNFDFGNLEEFESRVSHNKKADIVYTNAIIENQLDNGDLDHHSRLMFYSLTKSNRYLIHIAERFPSDILTFVEHQTLAHSDINLFLFTVNAINKFSNTLLVENERYNDIDIGHPTYNIRISLVDYNQNNTTRYSDRNAMTVSDSFAHLNSKDKFKYFYKLVKHLPIDSKNYHLSKNIEHIYSIKNDNKLIFGDSRHITQSLRIKMLDDLHIDWYDANNHFIVLLSIELLHELNAYKHVSYNNCTLVVSDVNDKRILLCNELDIEYIYLDQYKELMRHFKKDKKLHIVGNPPYQDMENGGSGKNMYAEIVNKSKDLDPENISLIIGARWFSTTDDSTLINFRKSMTQDHHISSMTVYPSSSECFEDTEIKGGVVYFHWDKSHNGNCDITNIKDGKEKTNYNVQLDKRDIIIPDKRVDSIVDKVVGSVDFNSFSHKVSRPPFGIETNFLKKYGYDDPNYNGNMYSYHPFTNGVTLYGSSTAHPKNISDALHDDLRIHGYVHNDVISNKGKSLISKYKVLLAEGAENGKPTGKIIGTPTITDNNSCCSKTFLIMGSFDTLNEAKNLVSYIHTKFFRFLLSILKNTQHTSPSKFKFIPVIDISLKWTDNKLYKKYNLSDDEILYIETMINEL